MNTAKAIFAVASSFVLLAPGAVRAAAGAARDGRDVEAPFSAGRAAINTTDRAENGSLAAGPLGGLRGWQPYVFENPPGSAAGSIEWSSEDAGGDPASGSLHITNASAAPMSYTSLGVRQCLRPGRPVIDQVCDHAVAMRLRIRVPPGQSVQDADVLGYVIKWTGDDCTGQSLGGGGIPLEVTPAGTAGWVTINPDFVGGVCVTEANANSIELRVVLSKSGFLSVPDPVEAYVDDIGARAYYRHVKGDINRDGETDLVLHDTATGDNVAWFLKDENRLAAPATISPAAASPDWQVAGVDDFDADGADDLLFWNSSTGETEFWLMNGTTRIGAPLPLAGALLPPWRPAATADLDADGHPDIVYRNSATQKIVVWTFAGTSHSGTLIPNPDQAVHANWEIVTAQDLNGDGHGDFLWYNQTSGKIVYWWMDANLSRLTGSFTNPANAGNNNWRVVAGGDFGIGPDQAGIGLADTQDLLWRNETSGRLVLWYMDHAGNRTSGLFVTPDLPAPATDWVVAGPR